MKRMVHGDIRKLGSERMVVCIYSRGMGVPLPWYFQTHGDCGAGEEVGKGGVITIAKGVGC